MSEKQTTWYDGSREYQTSYARSYTPSKESKRYDVILIGAGPNGLAAAAYLSKCGLRVLVLEKRIEAGGGLQTEAVTLPGFRHNTHAVYMMMVDYAPIYRDLMLEERYGVKHIYASPQCVMPLSDGRSLCLYTDVDKTCQSIANFSRKDAHTYREFHQKLKWYMDEFLAPATYAPPVPVLDQVVKLQATAVGREIMEISEKTPKEIVDGLFENEHVKALMLYLGCHWGVPFDEAGLGYLVLLFLNRATNYRLTQRGSHQVAQALYKIITENGGLVLSNTEAKRIILKDGVAKQVEIWDGTLYQADKAIISTINPHQTFLRLVGEGELEKGFVEKIKGWQWEKYSFLQTHLALDEPPNFTAAASDPEINKSLMYVLGFETTEELINDWEAVYAGDLPEKAIFNCCFPSVHDPSQAPAGRCSGLLSRHAPYRLNVGKDRYYDAKFKEEQVERCLTTLRRYAPNLTEEKVLWTYVSTPVDIENKFSDMAEGSFKQGAYLPLQMGYLRPNEDCSTARTPVKGLYLGGASCYPGGMVIWGSGYLAANAVTEDLGIEKWWSEPEIIVEARKKGTL